MTALYTSYSAKYWHEFKELRKKYGIDEKRGAFKVHEIEFKTTKDVFNAFELILGSIVFSYPAIESFCNEEISENVVNVGIETGGSNSNT